VLALYSLPGAGIERFPFQPETSRRGQRLRPTDLETGIERSARMAGFVSLTRFISMRKAGFGSWNEAYGAVARPWRLASGAFSDQTTQVYLNGDVFEDGAWRFCRRRP